MNMNHQFNYDRSRQMNNQRTFDDAFNRNQLSQASPIDSQGAENLNPNQSDPYSPNLVQDLLQGKKEWKNI